VSPPTDQLTVWLVPTCHVAPAFGLLSVILGVAVGVGVELAIVKAPLLMAPARKVPLEVKARTQHTAVVVAWLLVGV
jgi:hypothetical protein